MRKAIAAIVGLLNPQQWKLIGTMALGSTGPAAWLMSRKLGMAPDDIKMWLDFLALLTPVVAAGFVTASKSDPAMTKDAGTVPGVQVHVAKDTAPLAVAELAGTAPDVVPMIGGPRPDAIPSDRKET